MTTFDAREAGFERKFAHDAETEFRILARRNKLLGMWASARLGLTPEEADAYAKSVIQAEFEVAGDEEVFRKVLGDLTAAGVVVTDLDVREAMQATHVEARRQLLEAI